MLSWHTSERHFQAYTHIALVGLAGSPAGCDEAKVLEKCGPSTINERFTSELQFGGLLGLSCLYSSDDGRDLYLSDAISIGRVSIWFGSIRKTLKPH